MPKVLLIDDDLELSSLLAEYLQQDGFQTLALADGEAGVTEALSGAHDIIVLDVMMPRLDGIAVLRRIRAQSRVPVLMLTARGDDIDRIVGLELGADDYVPKPCTPRELAARLRAILRRVEEGARTPASSAPVSAGPLVLWPARRAAQWQGEPLELTGTEFNLLLVLARQAGRVVGRAELSEQGLGRPLARFDRSIDVHVSSLRHKLGLRPDGEPWIVTARGMGYQFVQA